MASTVQAQITNGSGAGTAASAEGGIGYGRSDEVVAVTTIPIPTSTGTHFSWAKWLALMVTAGGGSTHISNRKLQLASAPATGINLWFQAQTSYTQSSGNASADTVANGSTPTGYTQITNSAATVYDSSSVATANGSQNGKYAQVALGVDNTFVGGGGTLTLPSLNMLYDEGP